MKRRLAATLFTLALFPLFFSASSPTPSLSVASSAAEPSQTDAPKKKAVTCDCGPNCKCKAGECGDPNCPSAPVPSKAPYLKLPAEKKAKPGRYFCLRADTNCKQVKWIVPAGLDAIDPEIQLKDTNVAVLIGDAGTYTVQAYGALGDQASDLASCIITIGTPPPPAPPTPPPPPPGPVDPFTAVLAAAYAKDTDADKLKSLQFLTAVYSGMADQSKGWSDVKTNADALAKIKAVVEAPGVGLASTQIVNLRKAIAADFVQVFGTTAAAPIDLGKLSAELLKVSNALKGI